MSTEDVYAAIPSAQNFHPEFGYLCPSAQLRRKVRNAAMTVLAGMVIVTGTALALVPQMAPQLAPHSSGDDVREDAVHSVVAALPAIDKAADEGMPAAGASAIMMARSIPIADRSSRSHAPTWCDDLSGFFLAPQCQFGKGGKSHMTRSARAAASHRIATIPIGRADGTLQVEQQEVELSRSVPVAETAPAAIARNEAATVLPPEKAVAPAKKPVKTAHKQAPSRDVASADAMASAPLPGFGLFGLFRGPSRTTSW